MKPLYLLGIFAILAYFLQCLLGVKQIQQFNQTYSRLRKQGKVAIGRRAGKIQAGTIILFAVNGQGLILEGAKMQGISVLAKFKALPEFEGIDLLALTPQHPLVQRENKLTQQTILNAQEIYQRIHQGEKIATPPSPIKEGLFKLNVIKQQIQTKFTKKRSL